VLSTVLAKDVQTLNGVSTEVVGVYAEAFSAMFGGIVIAMIFQWQIALLAIGIAPLMVVGGAIGAMFDKGNAGNEDDKTVGDNVKEKEKKKQAAKDGNKGS